MGKFFLRICVIFLVLIFSVIGSYGLDLFPLNAKIADSIGNNYVWKGYNINFRVVDDVRTSENGREESQSYFVIYFSNEKNEIVRPPVDYGMVRYDGPKMIKVVSDSPNRLQSSPLARGPTTLAVRTVHEGDTIKLSAATTGSALITEKYILHRDIYWINLFLYKTDPKGEKDVLVGSFDRQELRRQVSAPAVEPVFKSSYEKALYEKEHSGSN